MIYYEEDRKLEDSRFEEREGDGGCKEFQETERKTKKHAKKEGRRRKQKIVRQSESDQTRIGLQRFTEPQKWEGK